MESDPPFQNFYKTLFDTLQSEKRRHANRTAPAAAVDDAFDLPLIDLSLLTRSDQERQDCKRQIVDASMEWGFFQVKNHCISKEILDAIRREQLKLFRQPFENKATAKMLDFQPDCYRWGTPTATSLRQFSWSEAFHVQLGAPQAVTDAGEFSPLRSVSSSVLPRLILSPTISRVRSNPDRSSEGPNMQINQHPALSRWDERSGTPIHGSHVSVP